MVDVGYFEAWQIWFSGKSLSGLSLHGMPMIWVGRLGKIVAFVGGLTVILDIVGPEPITELSKRVKEKIGHAAVAVGCFAQLGSFVLALLVINHVNHEYLQPVIDNHGPLVGIPAVVVFFVVMWIVLAGVKPVVIGTLRSSAVALAYLAKGLAHPRAAPLRSVGALLVLVGFHFDLLAS
ncbi:hypothetical protein ACIBP6_05445 [Nonomuraea terrae]|uniref:hypothetical protein n=1 Tax=Nonomuraea terrae TaxID=2530383 RepID=UPI0037B786A8